MGFAKVENPKSSHSRTKNPRIFFQRGDGNEFSNLIGSLRGPDFPVSAHGHCNAYLSFYPFVCSLFSLRFLSSKPFKCKSFFQNSFLLDKKVEKQKLSLQNRLLLQY